MLGAMSIAKIVDAHEGFKLVTDAITFRSARKFLWLVGMDWDGRMGTSTHVYSNKCAV